MSAYIDANVLFLAQYGTEQGGQKARAIIQRIQSGETAFTCSLTLDEIMWAVYRQKRAQDLRVVINRIYETPNLHVLETPAKAPLLALDFMEQYGLKPRDAIHCAVMRELGLATIYSDDADFDKVKWIKRRF